MPDWDDYKAEARERGSLAFETYVVISSPSGAPEDIKAQLPSHLEYQTRMEREGRLMFAGPMSDETGAQMEGMGLIVYRAPSFEAARAIAEADPMHAAGARTFTLRRWMINEGNLSLSVGLSGQTVSLA